MNKARRARIGLLLGKLQDLQAEAEEIRDEEQEYFDNMPEGLQGGDKGQQAEQDASNLSECADGIEQAVQALGSIELD